jgi:hypothetical protein
VIRPYLLFILFIVIAGCSRQKTVWDGVYTAAQAGRGRDIYNSHCVDCHTGDLVFGLKGNPFMLNWSEDSLQSLFDEMKSTMPQKAPSTLSDQQYLDVLALVLQKNGFPEGRRDLRVDSLRNVQITGRNGPQPLPSGAQVQAVGCLTKGDGTSWSLSKTLPLVRSRIRRDLKLDEVNALRQQRLGAENLVLSTNRYLHFNAFNVDLSSVIGHKVLVVGLLVRKGPDVYIEIFRAQEIDRNCG